MFGGDGTLVKNGDKGEGVQHPFFSHALYLILTSQSSSPPQEKLHAKREKEKLMEDFNSQKTMQLKKDEYVQSFTIHGLSKIFTGTKFESIFWTCVVLFGICISNIVIYGKRRVKLCSLFPIRGEA